MRAHAPEPLPAFVTKGDRSLLMLPCWCSPTLDGVSAEEGLGVMRMEVEPCGRFGGVKTGNGENSRDGSSPWFHP